MYSGEVEGVGVGGGIAGALLAISEQLGIGRALRWTRNCMAIVGMQKLRLQPFARLFNAQYLAHAEAILALAAGVHAARCQVPVVRVKPVLVVGPQVDTSCVRGRIRHEQYVMAADAIATTYVYLSLGSR